jgi:hypothetical protein
VAASCSLLSPRGVVDVAPFPFLISSSPLLIFTLALPRRVRGNKNTSQRHAMIRAYKRKPVMASVIKQS